MVIVFTTSAYLFQGVLKNWNNQKAMLVVMLTWGIGTYRADTAANERCYLSPS